MVINLKNKSMRSLFDFIRYEQSWNKGVWEAYYIEDKDVQKDFNFYTKSIKSDGVKRSKINLKRKL